MQVVEEFLKIHFTYQSQKYGNVIENCDVPKKADLDKIFVEAVEMSIDDLTTELAFLAQKGHGDPQFDECSIVRMMTEEIGYMVNIGIVPSEVYEWACEWSNWIATL